MSVTPANTNPLEPRLHIRLYDADGPDRKLALDEVSANGLTDNQLLWIDVACGDEPRVVDICNRLDLDPHIAPLLMRSGGTPALESFGECFTAHCVAVEHRGQLEFVGLILNLAVGRNFVISVHPQPVSFIDELRHREASTRSELGALSADSFAASLLDWQLGTYFEAVADFEMAVERLEVGILGGGAHRLAELRELRKGASRLRRMLAPHRRLYAGMARPDFRPRSDGETNTHFQNLDTHYERAMDMVENARDLVVGSFELFTSQTAWRTNRSMQVLTFYTVMLGALAVVAGVFGMNFEAPMFKALNGFWWCVIGMSVFTVAGALFARWRKWI